MQVRTAFLALNPASENKRYNIEAAYHHGSRGSVRIKVEVNQREGHHNVVESLRYRCELPDGQILWVPLDALRDERGSDIKDSYFDDPPRPWEVQAHT